MGDELWWKTVLKYFLHGLLHTIILLALSFVWAFLLAMLVIVGLLIGLIIGFILLFFLEGILNGFLTSIIWSIPIKSGWKDLLSHGFVLFIVLIIVEIPFLIVRSLITISGTSELFITIVFTVIYAFINGFVAKKVATWWEETKESEYETPSEMVDRNL